MHLESRTQVPRHYPPTLSHTEAIVKIRGQAHEYTVSRLSVDGALLVGDHGLDEGDRIHISLHLPLYPEIRLLAEVRQCDLFEGDTPAALVAFIHTDDRTEDHIQSALLSELERSQTQGKIADLA